MDNKILITERTILNDELFEPFVQYCYDSIINIFPEVNEQNVSNLLNFDVIYPHYVVTKNGKTCNICSEYAVIYNDCIDPIIASKWKEGRHYPMDDTTNYIEDVLDIMQIDMRLDYKAQHNGELLAEKQEDASLANDRMQGEKF